MWNSRFGESVGRVAAGFSLGILRLLFLSFVLDAVEHNMKGRDPGIDKGLVLLLVACCLLLSTWKYGSVRLRSQVIAQLPPERYLKY